MSFASSPHPSLQPSTTQSPTSSQNWTLSYLVLAPRHWKQYYGFDHNESPRYDIEEYGERMVHEGKLTRRQLARVKRVQSAQSNSIEHFGFFVGCVLLAQQAGLQVETINKFGLFYNLARVGYGFAYTFMETKKYERIEVYFLVVGECLLYWDLTQGRKGTQSGGVK
ncbi:hypothetical protein DID88_003622 [Monilinia fructigena]|uniref:Uncharacterized protein n=1 Tax=Monilinia fructigena TaxID=38457 RepID=A0A395IV79_9HELO|nr:hypothetical protein DID88_003622 [Monilinia fructigena]